MSHSTALMAVSEAAELPIPDIFARLSLCRLLNSLYCIEIQWKYESANLETGLQCKRRLHITKPSLINLYLFIEQLPARETYIKPLGKRTMYLQLFSAARLQKEASVSPWGNICCQNGHPLTSVKCWQRPAGQTPSANMTFILQRELHMLVRYLGKYYQPPPKHPVVVFVKNPEFFWTLSS